MFTGPLQQASRTCERVDFGPRAEVDRDLVEWNYGDYGFWNDTHHVSAQCLEESK